MDKVTYTVKRPFKYNGQDLQQGDEWLPAGEQWDHKIRTSGLVTIAYETEDAAEEKPKRGAKK